MQILSIPFIKKGQNSPALLVVVLIVLLAIPLTVWLVLNTTQLLDRRAAGDEVTVNFVPPNVDTSLGELYTVDIYLNSGTISVSGATITLQSVASDTPHDLKSITFETGEDKPFTEAIYNAAESPNTFTLLSRRPNAELSSGTYKIASATYQATSPGTITLSADSERSDIVGFKPDSKQVNFIVSSNEANITADGTLCRIDICTAKDTIKLVEQPRDDRLFNIQIEWEKPVYDQSPLFYKVFRNTGSTVAENHPDANQIASTIETKIIDNNNGEGYTGEQTVYYDIDTYIVCPDSVPTPTPTGGT